MTVAWVLGKGGLFGSALSQALKNDSIHVVESETHFDWQNQEILKQQFIEALEKFERKIDNADSWQIHWAAGTGTMASTGQELEHETAIISTLLELIGSSTILLKHPGTLTFASSAGAIYAGSDDEVITENSTASPVNDYGREKLKQEEILQNFVGQHASTSLFIMRIATLYGAGQSKAKNQGLLSYIARSILRHSPIHIFVPFDTIRDYITADDAAALGVATLRSMPHEKKIITKIIASEVPVTIASIIGTFKRVTRHAPLISTGINAQSAQYRHRIRLRSTVLHEVKAKKTSLLIGIAELLAAEKLALMQAGNR